MHAPAVTAGAIAIHVPQGFIKLLEGRKWERIGTTKHCSIATEHSRTIVSDPAFEVFAQFALPPAAVVLDDTLRLYPGERLRDATVGILQLIFGLYQLISDDAQYSVSRDGLASPFLVLLPYWISAFINTFVNLIEPPYTAITVLDISTQARNLCVVSPNLPTSREHPISLNLRLPNRGTPSNDSDLFWMTSPGWYSSEDFLSWLSFAYTDRVDVGPVDRLYRSSWLSSMVIIGGAALDTVSGFVFLLGILAAVGGWSRFRTSNHGLSLAFNLMMIFGIPAIQFILYLQVIVQTVFAEFRARKEYRTFHYTVPRYGVIKGRHRRHRRPLWHLTIAESVGIRFHVRSEFLLAFALFVFGTSTCGFVLAGINLTCFCNYLHVLTFNTVRPLFIIHL